MSGKEKIQGFLDEGSSLNRELGVWIGKKSELTRRPPKYFQVDVIYNLTTFLDLRAQGPGSEALNERFKRE